MGLLDGVKRVFNIGGCRLTMAASSPSYPQGSPVGGKISIEGGELDQNCDSLCVELEEFWTESRGSGKNSRRVTVFRTRERQVLGTDLSILPGDRSSYEFSLKLPENSRLSTSSAGWRLKASLEIPGAIDPCTKLNLKVTGATEFKAVAAACGEVFQMREKDNSWKWDDSRYTSFRMLPSGEMIREFDYVAFSLRQVEGAGGVSGKMIFNLQEKSFKDYLKAMLFMDRIERPLILERDQLFCGDGTVNSAAIRGIIEPAIREITESRNQYGITQRPEIAAADMFPGQPLKTANPQKKKSREFDPRKLDDYYNG